MHLMAGGRAGHLLIQRNCWLLARKGHGGAWKRSPPSKSSMEEGRRLLLHRHSTSTRQFLHLRTKCHLGAPPAFWEGPFSGPDQSPTYSGSWLAVFALYPQVWCPACARDVTPSTQPLGAPRPLTPCKHMEGQQPSTVQGKETVRGSWEDCAVVLWASAPPSRPQPSVPQSRGCTALSDTGPCLSSPCAILVGPLSALPLSCVAPHSTLLAAARRVFLK